MKADIKHKKISGIYCIKNLINGKTYVGKALCIHRRIKGHITALNTKSKEENCHLINSWHLYGKENFTYTILEVIEKDTEIELNLREREIFWIKELKCIKEGYNIREDSDTGMIMSDETKQKISKAVTKRFELEEERQKASIRSKAYFSSDEFKENLEQFKDSTSKGRTKYKFKQFDKVTGELIAEWDTVRDILKANPTYKRHNIYAVCSGEKPSIYGYKWEKFKI